MANRGTQRGVKRAIQAADWPILADKSLSRILKAAQAKPGLKAKGPRSRWGAELTLVGSPAMKRLNRKYRGKNYATDVLSFPAPAFFRKTGLLGELVICLPTMKKQAREMKHPPEKELEILLVHGVLHLLGFDHEKSERASREMARWEKRLVGMGLIERAR